MIDPLVLPFRCPDHFEPDRPIVRISPGGTRVFVSSHPSDDWAIVLDIPSGRQVREFTALKRRTRAFFLNEKRLVLFDQEGCTVYDLTNQTQGKKEGIPGGDGWLSPEPNVIVTGGNHFALYNVKTRKEVRRFHAPLDREVTSVGFSPDGRYLAAEFCEECRCAPLVGVWDLRANRLLRLVELASENECRDIALSADCRLAVCINGYVAVFGPDHAERIAAYDCYAASLRFSASGHILEVVAFDGTVAWIDPLTGEALHKEPPPADHHLTGVAVNARGRAAGIADRAVLVWQLPRWEHAESSAAADAGGIKRMATSPSRRPRGG